MVHQLAGAIRHLPDPSHLLHRYSTTVQFKHLSNMTFKSKFLSPSFKIPYVDEYTYTNDSTDIVNTITQKQCKYSFYDKSTWPTDPLQLFVEYYIQAENNYYKHNSCDYCSTLHPDHKHGTTICTSTLLPNTMQIATADTNGQPHLRTVLLKGLDTRGLIFFSNYHSQKGQELQQNQRISCLFYFKALEKQIRVEGVVERLSGLESDVYFHERPIPSQLGAGVSKQSSVLSSRATLESEYLQHVYKIAEQIESHNNQAYDLHDQSVFDTTSKENEYIGKNELQQTTIGTDYKHALNVLQSFGANDKQNQTLRGLVKRPKNWGGFLIRPHLFEFWQDGKYRLHSRIQYKCNNPNQQSTTLSTNFEEDSIAGHTVDQSEIQQKLAIAASQGPHTHEVQWNKEFLSP